MSLTLGKVKARLDRTAVYAAGAGILPVTFVDDAGRPGVTGLQLSSGRPVWGSQAAPRTATITAVTASTVVMVVDGKAPITMALDVTDGSTLWKREGLAGVGASGDGVVALKPLAGAFTGQGTPMVLDARTGRTRWAGRGPSRLREIGAGYVVFDTYGQDRPQRYEIVQLSSGDQITLTDAELSRVGQRSPTIVACDPPLLEWQAGSLLKALPAGPLEEVSMPLTGFSVRTGVGPYLWGTVDTIFPHLKGSVVALDSTGAQRTHAIPVGYVMYVDDQWLAVTRRGFLIPDDFSLELYAISTA